MNMQNARSIKFGDIKYPIWDVGSDEELEFDCPECFSHDTWDLAIEIRQFGMHKDVIVILSTCGECGHTFGTRFKLDAEIVVE